jgi:hypothetical protein
MTNTIETYVGNPIRGLSHLMKLREGRGALEHDLACMVAKLHKHHPFGLQCKPDSLSHRFLFAGGGHTSRDNWVVPCFLAHIRFCAGFVEGSEVRGLRIITTPFIDKNPKHHFVFFEMWTSNNHVTSGETTDFPEGTRHDMMKLQDVFAVLAQIYKLEIKKIRTSAVPLDKLYEDSV